MCPTLYSENYTVINKYSNNVISKWPTNFICACCPNRYFLLVDDVWSVSSWTNIWESLPKNQNGSSIVVTTRFKSVANTCSHQQGRIHMLKPLSYEESKKLFFEIIQDQDPGETKNTTDKSKINKAESRDHSHQSSRNDRSRNEERGTRKGTWDGFLHCGNENIPNSHPGTTFPECGTHPRSTFPVTIP